MSIVPTARSSGSKALLAKKCLFMFLVALGALSGFWLSTSVILAAEVGTIEVHNLSLRAGPGTQYRVIVYLPQGTQVRVLSHGKGWLEIEHNGQRGFIADHPRYVSLRVVNEDRSKQPIEPSTQDEQELKDLREKAETIDEQVRTSQSDLAVITEKEKAVINKLNDADEALSRVRRQVYAAEAGLKKIDTQIGKLQKEYNGREKEITANEAHAAERLKALYKLSWIGRVHLLATADSFFDFIQRKSSLEKILQQDESLLDKLKGDQAAIESVLEQLNLRKAEKRSLEVSLKKQMRSLDAEQKRRNTLLSKIQGEKKLALAALAALQTAAQELDSTMQQLTPEVTTVQPGSIPTTQNSFGEYKGLLSWPVRGKILSFYGPYKDKKFNVTNFQRGIDIQAERGEPIRAVADGHTIFAKWFKGFGNMMIIDHGDHYYTVYAHLEEIFKVKGDRVQRGEVIATVGDSGSLMGPALHFEVRHRGEPQDPLEWINKG